MSLIKVSGHIVNASPRKGEYATVEWPYAFAPQVGFDCLDEEQNIVVRVDTIDYGNGLSTIPFNGEEYERLVPSIGKAQLPANVESETLPDVVKQELAIVEDTAVSIYDSSIEVSGYDSEKYGDFVEGVFREVDEEVLADDDEEDDEFLLFKPVPSLYIINEHGELVRHSGEMTPRDTLKVIHWDESYSYGVAEINYKEVVTPKFNVTVDLKADEIDSFVKPLVQVYHTSPQELIDITSKDDGNIVIYGQLCLIEMLAKLAGKKIITTDLVCLSIIPPNYRVFVKVEKGLSEEYPSCDVVNGYVDGNTIIFNIIEDDDGLLSPVVFLQSEKYTVEQLMYIYMCALDRYKSFYICKNNLFVPPWSGNVSADVWLPVFKEVTLSYFGQADRTKLYKAICKANMLNNVKVPAAAFLCPIEFLMSSDMEAVVMYIEKLFVKQRPLSAEHLLSLKKLRKAKDFATLFEIIETFPNASDPYPVSTIGLFANEMQDVSMYRQLAGCTDTVLTQQLIQEFTQVLYRKCPKALAAILTAHRQDLNDKQKGKAVDVLKKNI